MNKDGGDFDISRKWIGQFFRQGFWFAWYALKLRRIEIEIRGFPRCKSNHPLNMWNFIFKFASITFVSCVKLKKNQVVSKNLNTIVNLIIFTRYRILCHKSSVCHISRWHLWWGLKLSKYHKQIEFRIDQQVDIHLFILVRTGVCQIYLP